MNWNPLLKTESGPGSKMWHSEEMDSEPAAYLADTCYSQPVSTVALPEAEAGEAVLSICSELASSGRNKHTQQISPSPSEVTLSHIP